MARRTPARGSWRAARGCAAAVLAVLAAAGCGQRSAGRLVFSVGGAPNELDVWEELAAQFQESAGIEVEILRRPADSTQQRQSLVLALNSRQSDPDLFLMDVAWLGLFAETGWLAPLEDVDRSPFFEETLETVDVHEGELIALPVYVDAGLLYYRTDLLDGPPPTTWDELREVAARVQEREREGNPSFRGFVWQGAQYEGLVCTFLEFAGSEGGLVQVDGRLLVDLPANERALELMRGLIHEDRISPPSVFTEMREEEARRWFQAGNALFERNWPYAWGAHRGEGSPVRHVVGVAPVPAPAEGEANAALGGWHVAISRFSDRAADARRFVDFITSREAQKVMVKRLGWNPGRKDLYDDPEMLAANPHFEVLERTLRTARPRPPVPYYSQVSHVLQRAFSGVLAGRTDVRAALAGAQREIDVLARRYAEDKAP